MKKYIILGIFTAMTLIPMSIWGETEKSAPFESGRFSLGIGYYQAFDLNVALESDPWLGTGGDAYLEAELGLFNIGRAVLTPHLRAGYAYDLYWLDSDPYAEGTRMIIHTLSQEIGLRVGFPSGWYFGSAFIVDTTLGGMIYTSDSQSLFTSENLGINLGVSAEVGYDIRLGKRSFLPIALKAKAGLGMVDSVPLEMGLTLGYKHRLGK